MRKITFGILTALILLLPAAAAAATMNAVIVLPAKWFELEGLNLAAREFEDAIKDTTKDRTAIHDDSVQLKMSFKPDAYLYIGAENFFNMDAVNTKNVTIPDNGDAFVIVKSEGDPLTIRIVGGSVRGDIYALFYMAERLRLDPEFLKKLNVVEKAPAFNIRIASGDTPENTIRYGYNTILAINDYSTCIPYKTADPEMLAGQEKLLGEIDARRASAKMDLERDSDLRLNSIGMSDEFVFPRAILGRPYAAKMIEPYFNRICFCAKKTWELYAAKYREILETFPELGAYMIRLGENYAKGDFFGNAIGDPNTMNDCVECMRIPYTNRIATFINRTHDLVVEKGHRRYIHRTWDTNDKTFHSNPDVYLDIISKLKDKGNFYTSIKYTATDFWRYNFPNPTIGIGDVPQIVEFQCTREYEGKGAYPNFIGEEIAEAYRYAKERGAAGVWNWHHGGGWNGPYLKTDLWNEANIYAASHLAWDPSLDSRTLAEEWAALTFGEKYSKGMADILLLSDDAVLKMVYFKAYAERKGTKWTPNENWVRDDIVKGANPLSTIYYKTSDRIDEMIAEKDEAVALVNRMIEMAEKLNLPEPRRSQVLDSLEYERLLFSTLRDYCAAYFYFRRWKDNSDPMDLALAHAASDAWRRDWQDYTAKMPALEWSATAYLDDGMEKAMQDIMKEIGN